MRLEITESTDSECGGGCSRRPARDYRKYRQRVRRWLPQKAGSRLQKVQTASVARDYRKCRQRVRLEITESTDSECGSRFHKVQTASEAVVAPEGRLQLVQQVTVDIDIPTAKPPNTQRMVDGSETGTVSQSVTLRALIMLLSHVPLLMF